jgi:hypothetical protein
MRHSIRALSRTGTFAAAFALVLAGFGTLGASAQGTTLQQQVTQIKASLAKNEQMLGRYTWQQQETVSVRGDVKKTALYQVQLGADGKAVKTDITQSASSGRKFGIRHRIAQNYEDYGKQIASLAQSYALPDADKIQQLYAAGAVSVKSAGDPGVFAIVVHGYVKPGDAVTLTFNKARQTVVGIQIASYLADPSDVVTIAVSFATLPDGTNHVATINIDGQSKSLTVQEVNQNYQKRA